MVSICKLEVKEYLMYAGDWLSIQFEWVLNPWLIGKQKIHIDDWLNEIVWLNYRWLIHEKCLKCNIFIGRVEETLTGLGWRRTKDKTDDNFKLKWVELKSQINYNKFREGEITIKQKVYPGPNKLWILSMV